MKGRSWLLVFFLMANFLRKRRAPAYPLYYFAKFLHIYDTPYSVIIVFTVIQSAVGTYLLFRYSAHSHTKSSKQP